MAHVNLGVDQRNPGRSGQTKLLRVAVGEQEDFEMVRFDWYREKLDRIQVSLNSRNGAYAWVIGDRGTGKSEVLSHLFCRQISMGSTKNPRLPLYISVSEEARRLEVPAGVPKGKVTVSLINHLCSRALRETFEFLREYDGNPELYKDLRKLLKQADFYDRIIPLLTQQDFDLGQILRKFRTGQRTKDAFKIAVYIDDMDKIDASSAREFFSQAQTDLSELVSEEQVVFLTSVTKKFIRDGREDGGLNYCLGRQHLGKETETKELTVPDLGDLPAEDVQDLINERLTYLHWGKPETSLSAPWVADFDRRPHKSLNKVIEDSRWESYDTRNMRRNGALLCLNGWLAARKQVSIRQVLRNLQAVLNDCDKPGSELNAHILEKKLKSNDSSDISAFSKEIRKRIKGVKTKRLLKEHEMLIEYKSVKQISSLWNDLLYVTMERISLGKWDVPSGIPQERMGEIKRLTNQSFKPNSAVFQFLNLIVDLSSENSKESLLPNVHSRSPDDVFSVINIEVLMGIFIQEAMHRKKTQFEQGAGKIEPAELEKVGSGSDMLLPGIVGEAYHNVIGEQFDKSDYADPRRAEELGQEIALYLVRGIIRSGHDGGKLWGKTHLKIKDLHTESWHQFRRSLLQWVALRTGRSSDEEEVLMMLNKVLLGRDPFALQELHLAQTFDVIVGKDEPVSCVEMYVSNIATRCSEDFPGNYFVKEETSWVNTPKCMKKQPMEVLETDLKVDEKVVFRIIDKDTHFEIRNLRDSLDILHRRLNHLDEDMRLMEPLESEAMEFRNHILRGLNYGMMSTLIVEISAKKEWFGIQVWGDRRLYDGHETCNLFSSILKTSTGGREWKVSGLVFHTMDFHSVTIKFRWGAYGEESENPEESLEIMQGILDEDPRMWLGYPDHLEGF